ncbi:MAG: siderophore-interacting protein [Rhodococcus sp. (in: high G+C Gram-positive bacteria)]|uniref:siderophore-interacting protein n=1 Tax=Rhodococcus sp. TaxID=1831 RepID=UPI00121C5896|nr:siderophore-interacting protein [Rhodococcus sp. (in: high G+C Gram-positive bacteria)]RZL24998.1 MAG: siderophore-interacting protein [Rhodococcus sp. (in: high G+C Gram-positive bacteria)]
MNRGDHLATIADVLAGTSGAKVPYPIGIRELEVVRSVMVGSGLLRLTLGGPELEGFESHAPDEHVRLVYPNEDGTLRLPERDGTMLKWPRPLPISREYTVRRYDPDLAELDIDFALHEGGFASDWAQAVTPGTRIHVAGPPGGVIVPWTYDKYLLAGDITALPAIARWLEMLPEAASGCAFIEITDASQEIELTVPEGVEVRWLHRGDVPAGHSDLLEQAVRTVTVAEDERIYAWISGEATSLKPLRRFVRDNLKLDKGDYLITGYWKRGVADFDEDDED